MPKSAFGQIGFRELWAFIKKRGSSTAHFKITHEGFALSFHGLTEAEYLEAVKQEEA